MKNNFQLFGPVHLSILGLVLATGVLAAWPARRHPAAATGIRWILGCFLGLNELVWYAYKLRTEGWRFPEGLPLNLCDLTVWLTAAALLTKKPLPFEIAYYAGIGGSTMALLTPDLWERFPSYPTVYFFVAHGTVVAAILFLLWSGLARPRQGSVWKVMAAVNGYAALIGVFNALYGTNYMYLCRKPGNASLLDFFGPWPLYLLPAEAVGLAIFYLLYLPFRRRVPAWPANTGPPPPPVAV